MMKLLLNLVFFLLLRIRYRISVQGMAKVDESSKDDRRPILFLANHQALIDPVIVMSLLYNAHAPRPLADEKQTSHPLIRALMDLLNAVRIPDLNVSGSQAREQVFAGIEELVTALKQGDNVLLYPSGRISRGNLEAIGANSGTAAIVHAVPEARIVLLRIRGLWGSRFSRARGIPSLLSDVGRLILAVLVNGVLFMPRRKVQIEAVEPTDFPRRGDKKEINCYLEAFYNQQPDRNTEVPLYWWQGFSPIHHDEAQPEFLAADTSRVPSATRSLVLDKLKELSGAEEVGEGDGLAADLGMDSLALAEFGAWLQQEFGVAADNLEALRTVSDCLLAADGVMPTLAGAELKPVSSAWFAQAAEAEPLTIPFGATIAELFLAQAKRNPDRVILSDQIGGDRTWRQLIVALHVLLPEIEKIQSRRVGIMMPGSVGSAIVWLAVVFSGKEPVMVNWTSGVGNVQHCLRLAEAGQVITARALTSRLKGQGMELDSIGVEWICLEDVAAGISIGSKLAALLWSRLTWRRLRRAAIAENAAILFTSGSEARPKAVPLTHANFLANVRDFSKVLSLSSSDRLLGILPIFHSLGLAGTVILPLCSGLRTVYWPNPTEGGMLARMTGVYGATVLISTPTFLQGMLRAGKPEQLQSLRLIFSGAEKCPDHLFAALKQKCPQAVLCEGYGVTECSPVVSVNSLSAPQPGTIGRILPSMQHVLLDVETGLPVGAGRNGRLLVRGPNVFSGYIGEARSPFVEFDGKLWYDTGDLMFERKGVLVFAGRLKRFVKLGGEMISLPAIEQALEVHYPAGDGPMLAVAAVGEHNPELVLLATFDADRQEANQAIRAAGLSPLHNIRQVRRVEQIPLLGSGKTDYKAISRMLAEG